MYFPNANKAPIVINYSINPPAMSSINVASLAS